MATFSYLLQALAQKIQLGLVMNRHQFSLKPGADPLSLHPGRVMLKEFVFCVLIFHPLFAACGHRSTDKMRLCIVMLAQLAGRQPGKTVTERGENLLLR